MDAIFALLPEALAGSDWLLSLQNFMQQGGQVLWWLSGVVALCWLLILERIIYLFVEFPKHKANWVDAWRERSDQTSWYARSIREGWLSQAHSQLYQNLNIIKVLVAICPMLGLLGTVTGMISVFDVMANQGSSNPKLMASGISLATLPTMAGMVAALTGMFFHARLMKACQLREIKLEKSLRSQR
ncbi:TolQ [Vibrio coralliilyticus]|uniref:TolQ n=1 Tax=Vibrio coralliilyticus TaxID=190893 RepID=A0A837GAN8_9VIBR|nr:MotA/TolQ/ExbB proton channel family protein [Vibrio coralliilyticus]KJY70801.1 TolQ [Vibrio coralliilyticus]NOJ23438.1 MotA/TolQ/ExbB proton channel family protein [Vibrio coralliilyticus]NRF30890.1 MotA/TolQ/ExbB proton channel family protein [Vibrio coralliilyticus]NRF52621.1 MotA/TolQ/ExbB proton channel family protein [Vibrio coralliilyticus]NRG03187.1 MotA/TolQ/ExbB proton channel family protein [Vibrio coralliilyticus]